MVVFVTFHAKFFFLDTCYVHLYFILYNMKEDVFCHVTCCSTCIHKHTPIHTYIRKLSYTCSHIHTHLLMYAHSFTYIHTQTHTHILTHTNTHTHTYTHKHIDVRSYKHTHIHVHANTFTLTH